MATEIVQKWDIPGGKTLQAVRGKSRRHGLYHLEFDSGGQLPSRLEGLWTSKRMMCEAVERYILDKDRAAAPKRNTVAKEVA